MTTTTILRPLFQDHPGEPVPEENFCHIKRFVYITTII